MAIIESIQLLLIMSLTVLACLGMEKRLSWLARVTGISISGISLIVLVAFIFSTLGIIPNKHSLYDFFMGPMVPFAISLLTFGLSFKNLSQLPNSILLIFGVGIIASVLGGVITAVICAKSMGEYAPKVAAQLTASYVGGGENAVAVKQILGIPNEIFVASFAIDNLLTSLWMIVTVNLAKSPITEKDLDKNVNNTPIEDVDNIEGIEHKIPMHLLGIVSSIALGLVSIKISELLSEYVGYLHPLLYLTLVAFFISRFEAIQKLVRSSFVIGTFVLIPFFFSIGAISDLRGIAQVPLAVVAMPFIIVGIHGLVIYSVGRVLKIPSTETSIASQALIGGVGTAVSLAIVKKWPVGVSMGIILGLVGYMSGNFCGIFVYHLSKFIISEFGVGI